MRTRQKVELDFKNVQSGSQVQIHENGETISIENFASITQRVQTELLLDIRDLLQEKLK